MGDPGSVQLVRGNLKFVERINGTEVGNIVVGKEKDDMGKCFTPFRSQVATNVIFQTLPGEITSANNFPMTSSEILRLSRPKELSNSHH
jgi:hypothetical protein